MSCLVWTCLVLLIFAMPCLGLLCLALPGQDLSGPGLL
ncbi:putative membrane protein [Chlamydia psittaci 84-8471/1]|nr:putative membrane protein [Chlamydia psittaci 84-8471/1]